MFDKILVGLDGSEHSAKALDMALGLSERCGAELLLCHALQARPLRPDYEAAMVSSAARDVYTRLAREQGEDILSQAVQSATSRGLERVRCLIHEGEPAQGLMDAVREEGADLLVIGTRGLTGLRELAMGSVAHKLSVASSCPVLVVR